MNIPKDELEKLLQHADKARLVLLNLLEDQQLKMNEIHESQLKYQTLFENSPISLWEEDFSEVKKYIDKHFVTAELLEAHLNEHPDLIVEMIYLVKVVNINQQTLKLYNAVSKEELYQNFDKIFTISSIEVFKNLLIKLYQGVYEFEIESVNKKLNGDLFNIKLKYSISKGSENSWDSILISVIDITEEREFKEKILQSEQRYLEAQAIARFGNWHIDYKTNLVSRSKEIYTIFETNEQELKPTFKAFKQLLHKDDLDDYIEKFENALKNKQAYEHTYRIITPNETIKYILEKGHSFYDENDEPLRTVGTIHDITENYEAELKVRESQLEYQVLFDSAPIALFEQDFTRVIQKLRTIGANATNIHKLLEDAELVVQCLQLVEVNNINQEALNLFKAESREQFHNFMPNLFTKHSLEIVKNIFIDISLGITNNSYESEIKNVNKEKIHALIRYSILRYNKESGKILFSVENITLRKKLLRDIEEQQENLKQAQQIALIGSFTLNHADNSISRSDEFYRIFEVTPDELPPREECFLSFVHPDDVEQLKTTFHNSIKNKEPYTLTYRINTGKANVKHINEKGNTYYFEDGKPDKTIGTLQDITEKVTFENELDKSRKSLENTLNSMADGFVTLSKDWIYTYVNPQAARFLNKSINQLLDKNIWEVFPDGINQQFHHQCIKALKFQEPIIFEEFYENQQKWFENRVFPTPEGLSIFFSDITERKIANTKIEEAHTVIINSNSIAIIWENKPTWPVKYVSENIERILGYTPKEMIDEIMLFSTIMHPDDLENTNKEALSFLNNSKIDDYILSPYRVYTKDGKVRWLSERTNVIRNEKGKAIELRGFIDDITEQYQLENAINTILSSVSKVTGNDYLREITLQLSHVLGAEHTFIGICEVENPLIINSIYNCYEGSITANFSYNIEGTPCADILNYKACSFPNNVANLFPSDVLLKEMEIEGYVGVPLIDSHQKIMGIMVGLYKNPIDNPHFAESIIQLFSSRTSAEIERLNTENQLKENEVIFNKQLHQLNLAIDAVNDVVFMTNTDGIFTYINEAFTKLYGYQPEEIIGIKTPRILKSGLYSNEFYKSFWSSLFEKNKITENIKNKNKKGNIIDIETSLSCITNEEDVIIGFIAIQRDITEKIKQNIRLEQSEKKYRDLFEKTIDATLLIKNKLFVDCNESALKLLGYKGNKNDFLNIHPSDLSPKKQPDGSLSKVKANEMMAIAIEKGSHQFEWVHTKTNGEEFFAEVTLTKVETLDENIIHCVWRDITEKKIAEDQLKASEAEGWALFENSPNLIWVEDYSKIKLRFNQLRSKGIINLRDYLDKNPEVIKQLAESVIVKKVNKKSLEFYDVATQEELFRNITDFFIEESYNNFKEELIALFNGNLYYTSETPIRKLNGQLIHLKLNVTVPETNKELLDKVIISFIDITDQKRIEKTKEVLLNITKQISEVSSIEQFSELVKKELGLLIDTSNFFIALYDKENDRINIPYFIDDLDEEIDNEGNFDAEGSLTGYVIHTQKPLLANQKIFTELEQSGAVKLVGPNSLVWLGVPLFVNNEVIGAIAVQSYTNENAFNVNDQKILEIVAEQIGIAIERIRHQIEIKTNEEKFKSIFELSPDMILVLNTQGIIQDCNDSVLHYIQYKHKNQLVGRSVEDVFRKGENQIAIQIFKSINTNTPFFGHEMVFKQNDGNYITVEVSGTFIKNEKIEESLILCVARDITLRKQHELEITNALEKAKEADRLKSAFLANMSHEIRTPMNGIIGFAELLQNNELPEEKRAFYANIIMNSSKQLLSIINDVLDMSTIEAGLVEIKKSPVSINEMLTELHAFFLQKSDEKKLTLNCDLPLNDALSVITTDKTKVQQILTNFISNAIKFTKKGSVCFGYKLKNNFLEFYVRDSGIGIDKKFHHEIFERFRQVNMEYTKETIGNGLGLSISKKLVELLGGEIWLTSEPKKGSTFYFTLPYVQDILTDKKDTINTQNINAMNKKMTILVAEDEEYNRIFIEEILQNDKRTILAAENGLEAIEIAKTNPEIKFILMDIKMPIINGIEALNTIREFNKTVPIIALTAFSMESDKLHLINLGFDDYVAKPIVKSDLVQIIDKYGH